MPSSIFENGRLENERKTNLEMNPRHLKSINEILPVIVFEIAKHPKIGWERELLSKRNSVKDTRHIETFIDNPLWSSHCENKPKLA